MVKKNGKLGWPAALAQDRFYRALLALAAPLFFLSVTVATPVQAGNFANNKVWITPINGEAFTDRKLPKSTFSKWIRSPSALITPEVAQLGLQLALERAREHLDRFAYEHVKALVRALTETFPKERLAEAGNTRETISVTRYAIFLSRLLEEKFGTITDLTHHCEKVFADLTPAEKEQLAFVFGGNLKLGATATQKEIAANPFWERLKNQTCRFSGYVAQSSRPEVWKFWLSQAVLSAAIPTEIDSPLFVGRFSRDSRVVDNAGKIDTYLSYLGKRHGLSLKAASDLRRESGEVRAGGRYAGLSAVSLLADFGSSWHEAVLRDLHPELLWKGLKAADSVLTDAAMAARTFPIEPIFDSLPSNYVTRSNTPFPKSTQGDPSAFEIGLVFWWKRVKEPKAAHYGEANATYGRSMTVSWLAAALDGFSSHANWSEALRPEPDNSATGDCTTKVFGATAVYADINYQVETALKSFEPAVEAIRPATLDEKNWQRIREGWVDGFTRFRNEAFRISSGYIDEIPKDTANWWTRIRLGSAIATIGTYQSNSTTYPRAPQKITVQLARAEEGWISPATVDGKRVDLWVPASYLIVNFSDKGLSPQEWKDLVQERGL
jgi:hypothetical protein